MPDKMPLKYTTLGNSIIFSLFRLGNILLPCLILLSFVACIRKSDEIQLDFDFNKTSDVDNVFLISDSGDIYYSQNDSGFYQPKKINPFNEATVQYLRKSSWNIKHPFMQGDKISYLEDRDNYGGFKAHLDSFTFPLLQQPVQKIYSSGKGKILAIKFQDIDSLYVIYPDSSKIKAALYLDTEINGISLSEQFNTAVVSTGNKLLVCDLKSMAQVEVQAGCDCKKVNPFIFGERAYFSSYSGDTNYSIFSCSITIPAEPVRLEMKKSGKDLRMPKTDGGNIFYVELVNSEYLLHSRNLKSGKDIILTDSGVVYDYQIWNGKAVYVYSDLKTPRALKYFDLGTGETMNITGKSIELPFVTSRISKKVGEPSSILLSSLQKETRGIILFFHPGRRNDDYSPRWDNMILPFCSAGFSIVCPNFPSSTGYGKLYEQLNFDSSVNYMCEWVDYLKLNYPKLPVYLYGISSGCVLAESCLQLKHREVKGYISAFGLSGSAELQINCNSIFILGEKDPVISYDHRREELSMAEKTNGEILVLSFPEEGHWIQWPKNFNLFYNTILHFFGTH